MEEEVEEYERYRKLVVKKVYDILKKKGKLNLLKYIESSR